MIYFRGEGQPIRNGLNIYPPREWAYSRGFILRLGARRKLQVRYSVKLKKWLVNYTKSTAEQLQAEREFDN